MATVVGGAPEAARASRSRVREAQHELVVCLHQDVVLPRGWDSKFVREFRLAERIKGRVGVAGVYGVGDASEAAGRLSAGRTGWISDQ